MARAFKIPSMDTKEENSPFSRLAKAWSNHPSTIIIIIISGMNAAYRTIIQSGTSKLDCTLDHCITQYNTI